MKLSTTFTEKILKVSIVTLNIIHTCYEHLLQFMWLSISLIFYQESKKVKEVDNWESKAKAAYEDFLNLENALLIELGLREVQED